MKAGSDEICEEEMARLHILLIDDHPGVREMTSALLREFGHFVLEADDGAAGLDLLAKDPVAFGLIISDYAMPLLSGTDVVARAREICPGLPGIIITGYADGHSIARRPEDVLVLTKPFTPNQLRRAIAEACSAANRDGGTLSAIRPGTGQRIAPASV